MAKRRKRSDTPEPEPRPADRPQADEADKRKTDTVRVYSDLSDMASLVASRRKITVAELLDPWIRGELEDAYGETLAQMHAEWQARQDG